MSKQLVRAAKKNIQGDITLSGSKSISNRVLIIRALCEEPFEISNLSDSDDTTTLARLLESSEVELDTHHAGTTYRFLTAYLAVIEGDRVLTGSHRMLERPVGPLVDALRQLGAEIAYTGNEGYPPLQIQGQILKGGHVKIDATISSQFLSALLLIAPTLSDGLTLELEGTLVSRPYLEMTLSIMQYFGVQHEWQGHTITVAQQSYVGKPFYVEADWSAASYYYTLAAFATDADIVLRGLTEDSLQGDAAIVEIGRTFGVQTEFFLDYVRLRRTSEVVAPTYFEYDFVLCPDIAQTVSVLCAGTGTQALFSGLQTLFIKETDRVAALQAELQKVGVFLSKLPAKFSKKSGAIYYMQEGQAATEEVPIFATYQDHRMAMAFAPLALLFNIEVEDPAVVSKSYPHFWRDLEALIGE